MAITNYGKQAVAWAIGSMISGTTVGQNFIQYCAIGSGSGTVLVTQFVLLNETDRNPLTGSPDFSSARKATFTADFGFVEMSGLRFTEFGFVGSFGPGSIGSMWQIERLGSVVFDGGAELQIQTTLEVL